MTEQQLQAMIAQQVAAHMATSGQVQRTAAVTPVGPYLHGPGGVLNFGAGVDPNIINAVPGMTNDLRRVLPWERSDNDYALFALLTSVADTRTGTDATALCDPGPYPGGLKTCTIALPFGEKRMATAPIVLNKLGRMETRADFLDYRLVGNPFMDIEQPLGNPANLLDEAEMRIAQAQYAIEADYSVWDITGDPANTAGSAATREYYGLMTQINTGHQDALTTPAAACPGADSLVTDLSGLTWESNSADIVDRISRGVLRQEELARRTGLAPVEFAFVMRREQFEVLANYWPCNYFTIGCNASGAAINKYTPDLTDFRDGMLNGVFNGQNVGFPFIPIRGTPYRVLFSNDVEEITPDEENAPTYRSSEIFLIPLRSPRFGFTGGWITNYQFVDYNRFLTPAFQQLTRLGGSMPRVFGGGRYLLYEVERNGICYQWGLVTEERIVCRAPFLAARWTGLAYRASVITPISSDGGGVMTRPEMAYLAPVA